MFGANVVGGIQVGWNQTVYSGLCHYVQLTLVMGCEWDFFLASKRFKASGLYTNIPKLFLDFSNFSNWYSIVKA